MTRVIAKHQGLRLSSLEGRTVSVALAGGDRIDGCQLVSAGRHQVDSLWLVVNGDDVFVSIDDVIELWDNPPTGGSR